MGKIQQPIWHQTMKKINRAGRERKETKYTGNKRRRGKHGSEGIKELKAYTAEDSALDKQ